VYTTTRIAQALGALALALLAGCATTSPETKAEHERKARGHYEMAMNHMREGRTGIAITELENARRLDPKDPWTELALGEAYPALRADQQLAADQQGPALADQLDRPGDRAELRVAEAGHTPACPT